MDCYNGDARSLWYEMKKQDKELRRKRKWLMGLSAPASSSRKRLKSNGSILPETMLREDDLFYESLKKHVEKGFGVSREPTELPTTCDGRPSVQHNMVKTVLALLNDLTNNGLYILAKVLAGSSILIEPTRWKMKKFISENLPKVLEKQCSSDKEDQFYNKLCKILQDPRNFQNNLAARSSLSSGSTIPPTKHSHHDAVETVLAQLKKMSVQTLAAMHRKLKGLKGSLPVLKPIKSSSSKARLAERINNLSHKMLSRIDKWDELPLPLMKAMDVACLSLKLRNQNDSVSLFCNYNPEIYSLQNELVKAIGLLSCKAKVPISGLKILKEILAPGIEYEVSNGGLRLAIQKMLTEFLFECSEMGKTPTILLDALACINRFGLRQDEVTEEVESILSLSAQVKQVLWDYLPDCDLDLEYDDAYMEDLEESDDGELFDVKEEELSTNNSDDISEVGSTSNSLCVDSSFADCTPLSKSQSECKTEIKMEPDDILFTPFNNTKSSCGTLYQTEKSSYMADTKDSVIRFSLSSNLSEQTEGRKHYQTNFGDLKSNDLGDKMDSVSGNPGLHRNKYVAVQQACDETSLIAYRLIGQLLKGFADVNELDLDETQLSYLNDGKSSPVDLQDATAPNEDQAKLVDDVDTEVIIQAVQELIPSFTHSELEKVRKILR